MKTMIDNDSQNGPVVRSEDTFLEVIRSSREVLLAAIVIVTFVILSIFLPNFFSKANLLSVLMGMSLSTLIVLGMTVVMVAAWWIFLLDLSSPVPVMSWPRC